jgi:hypothetical protein
MARPRGWTAEEIADIARKRAEGIPAAVMADEYDVSVEAIYCVAKRHGMTKIPRGASLSPRRQEWVIDAMRKAGMSRLSLSIEDAERGLAMWNQGLSASTIGKRLGRSKDSILGFAHRNGWPRRQAANPSAAVGRRFTDEEDAIIRNGVAKGLDDRQISIRLKDRSAGSVADRRARIGLTVSREAVLNLLHERNELRRLRAARKSMERVMERQAHEKPFVPRVILRCDPIPFTHEHRGCQWLTSDARPWMVCSNARVAGLSYCAGHYHLSIRSSTPPTEPEEAPVTEIAMEMAA